MWVWVCVQSLNRVQFFVAPWTIACHAPLSWAISKLKQLNAHTGKGLIFLCHQPFQGKRPLGGGPVCACHLYDSITSLRKPHQIRGIGIGRYFTPIVHHMQKNDGFICYTLGNQFQSPGDFLGLLSTFILLFLIYSSDMHNLNILSSF